MRQRAYEYAELICWESTGYCRGYDGRWGGLEGERCIGAGF